MNQYWQLKIVLDANVLYPAPIRDLLLNIADMEIYSPKWSAIIQEEWVRNLLGKRPDISRNRILRTVKLMDESFPEANVTEFEELIGELNLPDPDDRHVLAVAIKSEADAIVTFNRKDFPKNYLKTFNIVIYSPNEFLEVLHDLSPTLINQAFSNQLASLKNPPKTKTELIETLENCNIKSAAKLFGK